MLYAQTKSRCHTFHKELFIIVVFLRQTIFIERAPTTIYETYNVSMSAWMTINI